MNKFLPVIMLLAGAILAVTAFATAHAAPASGPEADMICIEDHALLEPTPEPVELKRCWHLVGMGKIVQACTPEPIMEQSSDTLIPECDHRRPGALLPSAESSLAPWLDVPPPKV